MSSGPWFNIKMSSYQYRKSHYGDKGILRILRPSYLHNGISYTGKMISLYLIRALVNKWLLETLTAWEDWKTNYAFAVGTVTADGLAVCGARPLQSQWWSNSGPTHGTITWRVESLRLSIINTLRPRQNGCHFADNIFRYLNQCWLAYPCIYASFGLNELIYVTICLSFNLRRHIFLRLYVD